MVCKVEMKDEIIEFKASWEQVNAVTDWWEGDKSKFTIKTNGAPYEIDRDDVREINYHKEGVGTAAVRMIARQLTLPATWWFNVITVGGIATWLCPSLHM